MLEQWANKSAVFCFGMSRERCDWACYNSVMGRCTVEKLNFDIWFRVHDGKFTLTITRVSSMRVNAQEMRKKKSILHSVSSPLFSESVCRSAHFGRSPFVMSQGGHKPHPRSVITPPDRWSFRPLRLPCLVSITYKHPCISKEAKKINSKNFYYRL